MQWENFPWSNSSSTVIRTGREEGNSLVIWLSSCFLLQKPIYQHRTPAMQNVFLGVRVWLQWAFIFFFLLHTFISLSVLCFMWFYGCFASLLHVFVVVLHLFCVSFWLLCVVLCFFFGDYFAFLCGHFASCGCFSSCKWPVCISFISLCVCLTSVLCLFWSFFVSLWSFCVCWLFCIGWVYFASHCYASLGYFMSLWGWFVLFMVVLHLFCISLFSFCVDLCSFCISLWMFCVSLWLFCVFRHHFVSL